MALLLAEGGLRLFTEAPTRIVELKKEQKLAEHLDDLSFLPQTMEYESARPLRVFTTTGQRLRPNAHVRIKNEPLTGRDIDIRTNSLGYRNRELGPKSLTRILFLGDSVTFEDFALEEETWVKRVEALSWQTPYPAETVNAGIGGISLINELTILEETGIAADPDIVVLAFYLNDLQESFGFKVGRLPSWLNESHFAWLLVRSFNILKAEMVTSDPFEGEISAEWKSEINRNFTPGAGDPLRHRNAFYSEIANATHDWGGVGAIGYGRK